MKTRAVRVSRAHTKPNLASDCQNVAGKCNIFRRRLGYSAIPPLLEWSILKRPFGEKTAVEAHLVQCKVQVDFTARERSLCQLAVAMAARYKEITKDNGGVDNLEKKRQQAFRLARYDRNTTDV